jgi:hypothetical protein
MSIPILVLEIDEGRYLIADKNDIIFSSFRVLRRALRDIAGNDEKYDIIRMVIADTNSNISNFAPNYHDDPSLRYFEYPVLLVPPFHLVSGYDLHAGNYIQKCLNIQKENGNWSRYLESRDNDPTDFVSLGSSLWQPHFLSSNEVKDSLKLSATVSFACLKLTCALVDGWASEAYLAMILARVHVGIIPKSRITNQLVAHSMAHLDYLSLDRSTAFISYPSDPILAQAARVYTISEPATCLKALQDYTSDSAVDLGDGGEFAAQILLLSAFDSFDSPDSDFKSVFVADYLERLFGPKVSEQLGNLPISKGRLFLIILRNSPKA